MERLNPKNIENILPLTPVQEGILFHYLKNPGSDFYFEQLCLDISGEIDELHFEKAWRTVIETNEILRTVFRWEKLAKPSQVILKEHRCRLSFYNLSAENKHEKETTLAKIEDNDRHDRFDLHGVPFRVILCKLSENKYRLIISNHHILYDGWSTGIILKEFFKVYHGLCQGERPMRLPVKTPFKEFIKWIQSRDGHKQEQFWRNYLAGFETPAALPIKRKIKTTGGAGDHSIILAEDLKDKLNVFIKKHRITLASVFYTAWGILLQKYGGNGDVVFGTTVSGRCGEIKGIEDMVGLFINTIPLRIRVTSYEKLHDAVFQTEKILREREPFENTPLVDIGSYSSLGSNESLFDTILAIENYPLDNRLVPGGCLLTVTSYSMNETTHYDLTVGILPFNEITINFNYKPELFAKETIENLAGHFKRIMQTIIENPETVLSQLEIISAEEKNRILYEFNNTAAEYPKGKTIHELFVEQAEKTPDHIALVGAADLSYRELNEWSGKLAGLLIERGVMADSIVGIMTERSIEMVIGILGILKSGGCYLPVDPEYPQERIDYMLKDSAARILISKAEIESVSNFVRRASNSSPSNLAYLIYTSGSTGKPKGVLIRHGSVVNRLNWMQQMYPLESNDIILQKTRFTFDVSVWELFWWSFYGARLCLLGPGEEKDPAAITNSIYKNHITTMHFVPSMLNEFLSYLESSREAYRCVSLKWVFASGEALGASQVDRFDSLLKVDGECRVKLINLYGPTEATVDVSYYNCCVDHRFDTVTAPIGKPIHNIHLYIVNIDMRLQPIGIAGELCIAGVGLARGYLNKPELTSEKFKHDLWDYPDYQDEISKSFAGVAYKTGDLARWLPDGNIEFLGRIDHQVKIRGFRIELGEIESRLLKHGKIKEAVVLAKEDSSSDKYLAAYFVSDIELSDTELKEYLLKDLPDYMMPLHFVRLEKIPLTPSGKMDRKALPEPKVKEIAAYVAPRNEIEMKLAEIWAGILGRNLALDRIGIDDNFFQLGGHSLKATMLVLRIHKIFAANIPLSRVFQLATIRRLAEFITGAAHDRLISIEPAEEKEYYPMSPAQKRLYILQQMEEKRTSYNMFHAVVLNGHISKERFQEIFKKLIRRHEILGTSFKMVGNEPVQRIHDNVEFEIEFYDLAAKNAKDREEDIIKHFIRPFDLSKAPLLRAGLIKETDKRHILVLDMHHIVVDGTSVEIFINEFVQLYSGAQLSPLKLQYKDFSEWQRKWIASGGIKSQEVYWLNQFEEIIPRLNLPFDYERTAGQGFDFDRVVFEADRELTGKIKKLVSETGLTMYMVLLATYIILLTKYSDQEDIVIGTGVGGRTHPDTEQIIGMFVNMLAIRCRPLGKNTAARFLEEIKGSVLAAFENQDYPFDELVKKLNLKREYGRNPLFDTEFTFQDAGGASLVIPGLRVEPYEYENSLLKFDLSLTAFEAGNKIHLILGFSPLLFKRETIENMAKHFIEIMEQLPGNQNMELKEIKINYRLSGSAAAFSRSDYTGFEF